MNPPSLIIRQLGLQPYEKVWQAMTCFTNERDTDTLDELWIVEHEPVFTQGQAGRPEHILGQTSIPIVQSDRGGQVTYHGPGQLILYPLLNLRRYKLNVRDMVSLLENMVVDWLATYGIMAYPKSDAPGVYLNKQGKDAKIASIGLRIRRGCSFHGVSINVDMDLAPFQLINPCGYQGLEMTQLKNELTADVDLKESQQQLAELFSQKLSATIVAYKAQLP